jgi:hypothetical protein
MEAYIAVNMPEVVGVPSCNIVLKWFITVSDYLKEPVGYCAGQPDLSHGSNQGIKATLRRKHTFLSAPRHTLLDHAPISSRHLPYGVTISSNA